MVREGGLLIYGWKGSGKGRPTAVGGSGMKGIALLMVILIFKGILMLEVAVMVMFLKLLGI